MGHLNKVKKLSILVERIKAHIVDFKRAVSPHTPISPNGSPTNVAGSTVPHDHTTTRRLSSSQLPMPGSFGFKDFLSSWPRSKPLVLRQVPDRVATIHSSRSLHLFLRKRKIASATRIFILNTPALRTQVSNEMLKQIASVKHYNKGRRTGKFKSFFVKNLHDRPR